MNSPLVRERWISAVAVLAIHAIGLWLLLRPAAVSSPPGAQSYAVLSFEVPQPPPPKPREPQMAKAAPAPRGRTGARAERAPVTAPTPVVTHPITAPIVTAPSAGSGAAPDGGNATAGSGSGAGPAGVGQGAGDRGAADGGVALHARLVSGVIRDRDYPKGARKAGENGTVIARFTVGPEGRVSDCAVDRSSGSPTLDTVTCRLISERFRYEPARDAFGRSISEERGWQQRWWFDR